MASMMEELITALTNEEILYQKLIPIAEKKMQAIIRNDLDELKKVTDTEQCITDEVTHWETKRTKTVENIAIVLNRKPAELTMKGIIAALDKQPEEQKQLRMLHDKIKLTAERLMDLNAQNKRLIEESLEMIEFNLNIIRSTRMSAGSNNYAKDASQADNIIPGAGMFDAKQ